MSQKKQAERDAIGELARTGMAPTEIAARLGLKTDRVYQVCYQERKAGAELPHLRADLGAGDFAIGPFVRIKLNKSAYDNLRGPAAKRGISKGAILRMLLERC